MKRFGTLLLTVITWIQLLSLNANAASVDSNVSALIKLNLNSSTKIYGLTAQDSLGKKTGALSEFASKASDAAVTNYLAFPANFFHTYDDTKDVVGGIYSQGKIVNDSWFDYGCGFDKNNKFHMFSLISTVSNEPGGKIVIQDKDGNNVEIVTAFNCYPWLIKDGVQLRIEPMPGADSSYLNSKANRAFMGQATDGTFMYGIVKSVTIYELQNICINLNLVNAVNTDGGASAGAYQDGKYVYSPGRELASAVLITQMNTENATQEKPDTLPSQNAPNEQPIINPINGSINISLTIGSAVYKKNGRNVTGDVAPYISSDGRTMVPIRFISEALGATVEWNNSAQTDTIQKAGIKFEIVVDKALPNNLGVAVLKDDRLFVPVRYVSEQLGASVEWNADTQTVIITQ